MKIGHYLLIGAILVIGVLLLMNNRKSQQVSDARLYAQETQKKYASLELVEALQRHYLFNGVSLEREIKEQREIQNQIRDSKRELYEKEGVDIIQDYHTNEQEGYTVSIEEGNRELIVTVKYFETTGSVSTGYSIPE